MEICGTKMLGVQLAHGYGAGGSDQIRLVVDKLIGGEVVQRGFDVVV